MKKRLKKVISATQYFVEHNESRTAVAKKYNIDKISILRALDDYQLYTFDNGDEYLYYFEPQELEFINYYFEHPEASYREVCRHFGVNTKLETFKNWCRILGYDYQRHYRVYFNRNIFHTIDTEEKAYWLGFILADGYIHERQYILQINLGEKDKEHLYKFLTFMGIQPNQQESLITQSIGGAYTKDNITYRVSLCSKELIEDLKDKGIFQAKSGKEKPFYNISKELIFHYIRGIFDGDGSIRGTQEGIKIVNSYDVCVFIRDAFIHYYNWEEDSYKKYVNPKDSIYAFEISNKTKDKQIVDALYSQATVFLDRKFKLYQDKYCRV